MNVRGTGSIVMKGYPDVSIRDRRLLADLDATPHPAVTVPIRPSLSPVAIRRVSWPRYHSADDPANYTGSGAI